MLLKDFVWIFSIWKSPGMHRERKISKKKSKFVRYISKAKIKVCLMIRIPAKINEYPQFMKDAFL